MFSFFLNRAAGCDGKSQYHLLAGQKHTQYRVTYNHPRDLSRDIQFIYDQLYQSLNPFDPQSILSKVNKNEDVVLDTIFIEAFHRSIALAEKTKGLYDPTCSPLIDLWGFGTENPAEPSDRLVHEIKETVGYTKIFLKNSAIEKNDSRVQLNFSAIGDGLSCDIIARYLDSKGVNDYMVDIGGEIVTNGKNRAGTDWSVGMIKPPKRLGRTIPPEFETIIRMKGHMSLATSGNYHNYRISKGKPYGHAINPLTGYPADNHILSATVIAPDCVTADAYATAIMAVEWENLDELLQTDNTLEYYIIYLDKSDHYRTIQSDGMKKKLGEHLFFANTKKHQIIED